MEQTHIVQMLASSWEARFIGHDYKTLQSYGSSDIAQHGALLDLTTLTPPRSPMLQQLKKQTEKKSK